eukprot:CFRG6043T1
MIGLKLSVFFSLICSSHTALIDKPIQLVRPDINHENLEVVPEAMESLRMIEGPVAVVAIVGPYHSGKSFMLNQLARDHTSEGFELGPSVDPTTMGIWAVGGDNTTLQDGSVASVIYLDTEGFSSSNVSQHYDSKIFAVSALMSSYLLYNSVKIIDQSAIDYLELLARQTQMFALKAKLASGSQYDALFDFPNLMWVIQDFFQDTKQESPTEWLHRMLSSKDAEASHHTQLTSLFPTVNCQTLFLPSTSKLHLQDLSQVEVDELTEDYQTDVRELKNAIADKLVSKSLFGSGKVNGAGLSTMLQMIVDGTNKGSLVKIPSLWQNFIQAQQSQAEEDCLNVYLRELNVDSNVSMPEEEISIRHERSLEKAIAVISHLLLGFKEAVDMSTGRLESRIMVSIKEIKANNIRNIARDCLFSRQKTIKHVREQYAGFLQTMPSATLNAKLQKTTEEAFNTYNSEQKAFKTSDAMIQEREILQDMLNSISIEKEAANRAQLEKILIKARDVGVSRFHIHMINTDRTVYSNDEVHIMIEQAKAKAELKFAEVAEVAENETIYTPFLSEMRHLNQIEAGKVLAEQTKLVQAKVKRAKADTYSGFVEFGDTLLLPMEEEEFAKSCDSQIAADLDRFDSETESYRDMGYGTTVKTARDILAYLMQQKTADLSLRNVRAYGQIVDGPLEAIRSEISEIISEWSIRGLITSRFKEEAVRRAYQEIDAALSNNNKQADSYPNRKRQWSNELKRRVAERFVEDNMSREIKIMERRAFLFMSVTTFIVLLSGFLFMRIKQ